jgi:hypothetical protein
MRATQGCCPEPLHQREVRRRRRRPAHDGVRIPLEPRGRSAGQRQQQAQQRVAAGPSKLPRPRSRRAVLRPRLGARQSLVRLGRRWCAVSCAHSASCCAGSSRRAASAPASPSCCLSDAPARRPPRRPPMSSGRIRAISLMSSAENSTPRRTPARVWGTPVVADPPLQPGLGHVQDLSGLRRLVRAELGDLVFGHAWTGPASRGQRNRPTGARSRHPGRRTRRDRRFGERGAGSRDARTPSTGPSLKAGPSRRLTADGAARLTEKAGRASTMAVNWGAV